jgi:hypothetical protein
MLKTDEAEIKKEHTMLMVNKSVDFKKSEKKTKVNPKKGGKFVVGPPKVPKLKPNVMCFYYKEEDY